MTRSELLFRMKDVLRKSGVDDAELLMRQLEIHTDTGLVHQGGPVYMHRELGLVSGPSPKIFVGEARTYPNDDGTVEVITSRQGFGLPNPLPIVEGVPHPPDRGGYTVATFKVNR